MPPPNPVARARSVLAKKPSSRSISPKALSSGAQPLKKPHVSPIIANKSSIIARLKSSVSLESSDDPFKAPRDPSLPPSLQDGNKSDDAIIAGDSATSSGAPKKMDAKKKDPISTSVINKKNDHVLVHEDDQKKEGADVPSGPAQVDLTGSHVDRRKEKKDVSQGKRGNGDAPSVPSAPPPGPSSLDDDDMSHQSSRSSKTHGDPSGNATPHKVLRRAFSTTMLPHAHAPLSMTSSDARMGENGDEPEESLPTVPPTSNPIKHAKAFTPHGALPNGFPEARDLTVDVQANKLPIRGQSRFSRIDLVSNDPPMYLDNIPLPPADLLRSLSPSPQLLLSGDWLPYGGFLRSLSIADVGSLEWTKLIGLVSFLMLPAFSPFTDEGPFLSHNTYVKHLVNMLREAKKQNKTTTVWLAYTSRSNVPGAELATLLDRRIDLIPSLPFLFLSVVCLVIHLGQRHHETLEVIDSPSCHDMPLIIFQLTSAQLPKGHVPKVVEFYPRLYVADPNSDSPLFTPVQSLFQIRLDVPNEITRTIDGADTHWSISGSLPLMLLINGLSPDDSSTILHKLTAPRITKSHWPVAVSSATDGFKVYDFHVPLEVLAKFYEEQMALADMDVHFGLLHSSIKEASVIVTHQPPFRKGAPRRSKMPANEIRTAIEMNPHLKKKLEFVIFLNKYDVLVMVKEDILLQPTIQEIEELGDMLVISAVTHQRVHARDVVRSVEASYALVRFSPAFSVPDVLQSVATFGPVHSHQLFQQAGLLLIRYQANESAYAAFGATLPGPVFITSGSVSMDLTTSLTDRLERLRLAPLPPPQLNESNLAAIPPMSSLNIPDMIRTAPDLSHVFPLPSIQGTDQEDDRMTGQVKRSRGDDGETHSEALSQKPGFRPPPPASIYLHPSYIFAFFRQGSVTMSSTC